MPGSQRARIRGIDVVPLLERDTQLAALAEYAGEARRGDGRLVLIAGEAGVGKSALVEQLERGLPEASWHWGVVTACSLRGRSVPSSTLPASSGASCWNC